jgi:hypothetical protein
MAKDVRRAHPRVAYERRISLMGADGKPAIVGRTLNLSPSGIYVRAPHPCAVGTEVVCDLPLPDGNRRLRGRVARTQELADATGIGIQFVDLSLDDSASLHHALSSPQAGPVTVKVLFEGMSKPIKCQGMITAEGVSLSTALPFLRLGSEVQASVDGDRSSRVDARGVLTNVRLEPVASDGVPRLGVQVDIDGAAAAAASSSSSSSSVQPSRAGELVSAASLPRLAVLQDGEERDDTAVVAWPSLVTRLLARFQSLHAWGFVAVATLTFAIVYAAMHHWSAPPAGPASDVSAQPAARPTSAAIVPLVVPTLAEPHEEADREVVRQTAAQEDLRQDEAQARAPAASATRPARAKPRIPGSPFRFDATSGRYQLRNGARLDMHGGALTGISALVASADSGNLRGINVEVGPGALHMAVPLDRLEPDNHYGVQVTPSWPTTLAIVGKTTNGFTVSFGTPAPEGAHLDWFLVR